MTLGQIICMVVEGKGYEMLYTLYDDPEAEVTKDSVESALVQMQIEIDDARKQLEDH